MRDAMVLILENGVEMGLVSWDQHGNAATTHIPRISLSWFLSSRSCEATK